MNRFKLFSRQQIFIGPLDTHRWLSIALLFSSLLCAAAVWAADREIIIVGGDRDYPPYEFIDAAGRPSGYNVDLTRAIAEVMGLKVEFRLVSRAVSVIF